MKARSKSPEDASDGDEADDDGAEGTSRAVPGPLSQEALKEIRELGNRTMKEAEALAQKYGKSTRTIMIAAGLGVQHSRHVDNFANKFKTWYSRKYPVREGGEFSYVSLVFAPQPLI
jgi:shikimate 5-dehydrogenase